VLKSKFLASLGVALLAGILAWLYLDYRENDLLRRGHLVRVIAARRYLSAYSRIKAGDLEWREMPAEYVVKGYVTSDADAVEQLALVAFNADEPLTYNKISSGSASLSNSVPEGMRALSLPVDKVSGIAGLIRPGDLVDVLYLDGQKKPDLSVAMLFQGVKVLAAGNIFSEHQEKDAAEGSVTLAFSPQDAQLAMLALNLGALQLALRSGGDSRLVPSGAQRPADLAGRLLRRAGAPASGAVPSDFIPQKR
jgi:pilus assembly protein CpaB